MEGVEVAVSIDSLVPKKMPKPTSKSKIPPKKNQVKSSPLLAPSLNLEVRTNEQKGSLKRKEPEVSEVQNITVPVDDGKLLTKFEREWQERRRKLLENEKEIQLVRSKSKKSKTAPSNSCKKPSASNKKPLPSDEQNVACQVNGQQAAQHINNSKARTSNVKIPQVSVKEKSVKSSISTKTLRINNSKATTSNVKVPKVIVEERSVQSLINTKTLRINNSKATASNVKLPQVSVIKEKSVESLINTKTMLPCAELDSSMDEEVIYPTNHKCAECDFTCTEYKSLVEHIHVHDAVKEFYCKVHGCGRKFFSQEMLDGHTMFNSHKSEGSLCYVCGKPVSTKTGYNAHLRSHFPNLADKKFHCHDCDKMFATKPQVHDHITTEHLKLRKSYVCAVCGRELQSRGGFRQHMLNHSDNPRRDKCKVCSKTFCHREGLARHMRSHTGETPFDCKFDCGRSFTMLWNKIQHERLHTGEMPYKCIAPGCDKAFRHNVTRKLHHKKCHPDVPMPTETKNSSTFHRPKRVLVNE